MAEQPPLTVAQADRFWIRACLGALAIGFGLGLVVASVILT